MKRRSRIVCASVVVDSTATMMPELMAARHDALLATMVHLAAKKGRVLVRDSIRVTATPDPMRDAVRVLARAETMARADWRRPRGGGVRP